MKRMKRVFSMMLAACLCLALALPAAAAGGDLSQLPCAGDRGRLRLSREQAAAYAQQLYTALERAKKEWNENGFADTYLVCATLVATDSDALLWIADYELYPGGDGDYDEWFPGQLEFRGSRAMIAFEELWQWDGKKAVAFEPMKATGTHFALREGGIEAFTIYLGTDVDGDAWDAYYPYSGGKPATTPAWCRCWCCAYDYRLEEAGVSARQSHQETARALANAYMKSGYWPQLPFDWSTFHTNDEMWDMAGYFSVRGGTGWQKFYGDDGPMPDINGQSDAVPGAILTASSMTFADDCWEEASVAAAGLEAYAHAGTGASGFTDVPDDAYYADAVHWAVESGITNGTGERTFSPQATCTRGQVVTFLWRMAGQPEPRTKSNAFRDVKSGDYFYKPVLWAVENGITNGTSATAFSPNDLCTRGHVITFLWRYLGKPGTLEGSALAASLPRGYYTEAVAFADEMGLLAGTAQAFEPNANCPRADIVLYLYRINNLPVG